MGGPKTSNAVGVGIDLGTTFSSVAVYENGRVTIVPNRMGNRETPSVVAFPLEEDSLPLVGEPAVRQMPRNLANTVQSAKRFIGRSYRDKEVQKEKLQVSYAIKSGPNMEPLVCVRSRSGKEREFSMEDISCMVLKELKASAERYLGHAVTCAVVTVPAYFSSRQRLATRTAAKQAGIDVLRLLSEPTAAGLAYHSDHCVRAKDQSKVIVFDWGGGTLDVSAVKLEGESFRLLAVAGDTHLGGIDFDRRLAAYLVQEYKEETGLEIPAGSTTMLHFNSAAEVAKRELSFVSETPLEIPIVEEGKPVTYFSTIIQREKLESLTEDLFERALGVLERCMRDAGLEKGDIGAIIPCGGTSRMPKVWDMLRKFHDGKEPEGRINPGEAIVHGAAIQAALLMPKSTTTRPPEVTIVDVAPLSLGTSIRGDLFVILIPRNSPLPASGERIYVTTKDNRTEVGFAVCEGERPLASKNSFLGRIMMTDVTPAPKEEMKFLCSTKLDLDGILRVELKDLHTGKIGVMETYNSQPTETEVARVVSLAEQHREEDQRKVASAEARNRLEDYVDDLRKALGAKKGSLLNASTEDKVAAAIREASLFLELAEDEEHVAEDVYKSVLNHLKLVGSSVMP